jgi:Flp pilus assembly protein TadG
MRSLDHLSKSSALMWFEQQRRKRGERLNPIHGLKSLLRRSQSEEGQSLVEFALTSLMFFFLMFAVFDFGHLFFEEMDVQYSLQEAVRYGSTGNHLPDPKNPGNVLSRVVSITDTFENSVMGATISNIQISSLLGGSGSAGGPGDMLTVTATASTPLMTPLIAQLFPNGQFTFTQSITVKNEPFPPSETK